MLAGCILQVSEAGSHTSTFDQVLRKGLKETRMKELGPLPQNSQNANNNDEILMVTLYITDTVPSIYTY